MLLMLSLLPNSQQMINLKVTAVILTGKADIHLQEIRRLVLSLLCVK